MQIHMGDFLNQVFLSFIHKVLLINLEPNSKILDYSKRSMQVKLDRIQSESFDLSPFNGI
jgi:hypothetical protein